MSTQDRVSQERESDSQIHFRWSEASKEKNKAIKPLDEKTGEYFHNLGGVSKAFLGKARNPEASRESLDRLDDIKIKSFHMAEDMINQTENNLTDGRKYLKHAQHTTD